jgi:hypothetical protein
MHPNKCTLLRLDNPSLMAANSNRSGYGIKTVLAVGFGATCLAFLDNAKLMRGVADYAGTRMPVISHSNVGDFGQPSLWLLFL